MSTMQRDFAEEVGFFIESATWVAGLVSAIPDKLWDSPGLGEWNLRSLVGHTSRALLTVEQYLSVAAQNKTVYSAEGYFEAVASSSVGDHNTVRQRGIDAGIALGSDPAVMFRTISDRVSTQLRRADDILIESLVGGICLGDYLATRTFEMIVHGLDICEATGSPMSPPDEAMRSVLDLATSLAVRAGGAQKLLFALTGRGEIARGYSVLD